MHWTTAPTMMISYGSNEDEDRGGGGGGRSGWERTRQTRKLLNDGDYCLLCTAQASGPKSCRVARRDFH